MKILRGKKDGGPESNVTMWGVESKRLGSILVLKFEKGSREAFHSHAFDAVSYLLSGKLGEIIRERVVAGGDLHTVHRLRLHQPSGVPIVTPRELMHQVHGLVQESWVLTFRSPWQPTWEDWPSASATPNTLGWGRQVLA